MVHYRSAGHTKTHENFMKELFFYIVFTCLETRVDLTDKKYVQ